jgi:hypothetical protein
MNFIQLGDRLLGKTRSTYPLCHPEAKFLLRQITVTLDFNHHPKPFIDDMFRKTDSLCVWIAIHKLGNLSKMVLTVAC